MYGPCGLCLCIHGPWAIQGRQAAHQFFLPSAASALGHGHGSLAFKKTWALLVAHGLTFSIAVHSGRCSWSMGCHKPGSGLQSGASRSKPRTGNSWCCNGLKGVAVVEGAGTSLVTSGTPGSGHASSSWHWLWCCHWGQLSWPCWPCSPSWPCWPSSPSLPSWPSWTSWSWSSSWLSWVP